ncbi:S-layer homology domain-containing protein [Lawsonibacter sp. OA9]|uniref:S-layer homology domain-containing protein n=1 Tax=Lawsonibacter sp. OA9 TaxID=2914163 RepID=UPI001F063008|nr:S-layer homology domain-containing protein [Lawsonibacter sp. OA9]MCH1980794.1 S-layer homology domain-containing protein [Lawsonibacter sp. OA9]
MAPAAMIASGGSSGSSSSGSAGVSGGTVSASQMNNAVDRADQGEAISIDAGTRASTSLLAAGLESAAGNDNSLTVSLRYGEVTLSPGGSGRRGGPGWGNVTSAMEPVDVGDPEQPPAGGRGRRPSVRPDYRRFITDFEEVVTTVSLPYDLPVDQDPVGVVVWFLDDDGNITHCETMYDTRTGRVIFTIRHFSKYAIGYKTPRPFTDMDEDTFYADAVEWAAENNITAGTSATTFGPNAVCTRGQIVTFMFRDMAAWSKYSIST